MRFPFVTAQYLSILSPYLNLYSNFQIIFSRWVLSVAVSSLSRQQFSLLSTPPTAPHLDPTGGRCKPLQSPGQNVSTTKVMRFESDTFGDPLYLLKSSPTFWQDRNAKQSFQGCQWSKKIQIFKDFFEWSGFQPSWLYPLSRQHRLHPPSRMPVQLHSLQFSKRCNM